jgi:predicted enzyme related to lactoylglutathione lyase
MSTNFHPEFRFYYFTNRYASTVAFYKNILQLKEVRSWNRGEGDKGTIFQSPNGTGWIEIEEGTAAPIIQGGLYIQVDDVDAWYEKLNKTVKIIQPITNTSYGHRNFKFEDPNRLSIGLFKYLEE